ncbi:hypothetical protein TNCV_4108201 [Trichonephila clavipes]|nr:hypothetical protein TNCV_4108201 [Trichonephila clavipes]
MVEKLKIIRIFLVNRHGPIFLHVNTQSWAIAKLNELKYEICTTLLIRRVSRDSSDEMSSICGLDISMNGSADRQQLTACQHASLKMMNGLTTPLYRHLSTINRDTSHPVNIPRC